MEPLGQILNQRPLDHTQLEDWSAESRPPHPPFLFSSKKNLHTRPSIDIVLYVSFG